MRRFIFTMCCKETEDLLEIEVESKTDLSIFDLELVSVKEIESNQLFVEFARFGLPE